jgi:hypothetical protein
MITPMKMILPRTVMGAVSPYAMLCFSVLTMLRIDMFHEHSDHDEMFHYDDDDDEHEWR